jgi:osmotically-inducible protein OsmY
MFRHTLALSAFTLASVVALAAEEKTAPPESGAAPTTPETPAPDAQAPAAAEPQISEADARLAAQIKDAYWKNSHLQSAEITTQVHEGVVHLTGTVRKSVERDLAGELAKSTPGVRKVKNEIVIEPPAPVYVPPAADANAKPKRNSFVRWADDASTTAAVKSRLLANENTGGLKIHVATNDDVVTLSGEVRTAEERELAELITRNTADVVRVDNQLKIVGTEPPATTAAVEAQP